ncbi:hypothetical protein [Sphingopyxis witflariensis]|uniref:Uncharacterized protein n=1 Tax=Sphingopyxis witflariensis TaxID=173675 RepID=A0A246K028_9SPHN|nr:hypothetical protein [Sphingopyxis witflariensis]OWQ98239.1 hypothetical protein CDQ91_06900 [Sphingopyxis witflariensis]
MKTMGQEFSQELNDWLQETLHHSLLQQPVSSSDNMVTARIAELEKFVELKTLSLLEQRWLLCALWLATNRDATRDAMQQATLLRQQYARLAGTPFETGARLHAILTFAPPPFAITLVPINPRSAPLQIRASASERGWWEEVLAAISTADKWARTRARIGPSPRL